VLEGRAADGGPVATRQLPGAAVVLCGALGGEERGEKEREQGGEERGAPSEAARTAVRVAVRVAAERERWHRISSVDAGRGRFGR
jgi:hypothetical protein